MLRNINKAEHTRIKEKVGTYIFSYTDEIYSGETDIRWDEEKFFFII